MEFKQVIKETNKFLTRMRNALGKVADIDSAIEVLIKQFDSKDTSFPSVARETATFASAPP